MAKEKKKYQMICPWINAHIWRQEGNGRSWDEMGNVEGYWEAKELKRMRGESWKKREGMGWINSVGRKAEGPAARARLWN